jgi:hypothetical protein
LNARIEKYDGGGNLITQWGSSGSGNGQFNDPSGIALDDSGNVAGRRISAREVRAIGVGEHVVDLAAGTHVRPGLYLVRLA